MAHASPRAQPATELQDIDSIEQILFPPARRIGALHRPIHW